MIMYLNGVYVPDTEAKISVLDRGFIFGDGLYEVWRAIEGRFFEPARHQARFENGLRALKISQPDDTKAAQIRAIADRLFAENSLQAGEATLYLQVTRGVASRTHHFPAQGTKPTVMMMARVFTPSEARCRTGGSAITVPDIRWHRSNIKSVQLLPNVLANEQAHQADALEALFVRDGLLTEGTHSNLFGVIDGVLRTHPANDFVLPGITREVVLEVAESIGVPRAEKAIGIDELARVDELFVCGTTMDVTPIIRVDGAPVAGGSPGPITNALYEGLLARLYSRQEVAKT
jgi:D-alanine transaminase